MFRSAFRLNFLRYWTFQTLLKSSIRNYKRRLTFTLATKETPVLVPHVSTLEFVGDVGAPVLILSDNSQLVLPRCKHFACFVWSCSTGGHLQFLNLSINNYNLNKRLKPSLDFSQIITSFLKVKVLSSSLLLSKSVSLIRRCLWLEVTSLGLSVLGFKVCRNAQPWHVLDWRDLVRLSLVFI